ncbi:hypothetical protein OU995_19865 [Roseateles sp. SL47]|uniref:hypothetical protein n=1 Tax=Roseateles sp. SL47 TaxID=2995138 RepID=UPI0022703498|nr:hypothetical protein [Roseateles sp. SL47]WAC71824.1 hypothetical protein OU995_19865 [Roseateles sp. SL47]
MFAPPTAAHRSPPHHARNGICIGMPALPHVLRWWVLVCVVSLLGFQALGLVHRALHGGSVAPRLLLASSWAAGANPAHDIQPSSLGHLPGSGDCQLLDQLSTALGPISQALAWTALLPDHPVATPHPHSATVAQVWRALARAPPAA